MDPDVDLCRVCGDEGDVVQDEQGEGLIIPKEIPEPNETPLDAQKKLTGHAPLGVLTASWADAGTLHTSNLATATREKRAGPGIGYNACWQTVPVPPNLCL